MARELALATRAIGKTAKGRNRRIGKGKTSSSSANFHSDDDNSNNNNDDDDDNDNDNNNKNKNDNQCKAPTKDAAPDLSRDASILPGALKCFKDQKTGKKGLNNKLKVYSKSSSLRISRKDYNAFNAKSSQIDANAETLDLITKNTIASSHKWLWLMANGHNLLLYGLGSKRKLVDAFVREKLTGEGNLCVPYYHCCYYYKPILRILNYYTK